jgi:hypothetical protein
MAKKFDVVAITGKYQGNDGKEKSRYLNIGAVIETRNGLSLKLEAVPVGWDGWAYLNEPQQREQRAPANAVPQDTGAPLDDSIPF